MTRRRQSGRASAAGRPTHDASAAHQPAAASSSAASAPATRAAAASSAKKKARSSDDATRPPPDSFHFEVAPLETKTFPVEWFVPGQPVFDQLTCPICLNVVRDPPNLETCCHPVCRGCLTEWRHKGKNECPVDRISFGAGCIFAPNPFVQSLVWQLRARCLNHDDGCEWTGPFGVGGRNLTAHHLKCDFAFVHCSHCKNWITLGDAAKHQVECNARIGKCANCRKEIRFVLTGDSEKSPTLVRPHTCTHCEVCPRGCEDPHKAGSISVYSASNRAAHAAVCKRAMVCTVVASADRGSHAADQVVRWIQPPVPRTSKL